LVRLYIFIKLREHCHEDKQEFELYSYQNNYCEDRPKLVLEQLWKLYYHLITIFMIAELWDKVPNYKMLNVLLWSAENVKYPNDNQEL